MEIRFYKSSSGRSPVEEFLDGQSQEIQHGFLNALTRLARGENLEFPLSRNLSSIRQGLHELRLKDRGGIYRVFYFIKTKEYVYIVHAMKKKSRELQRREVELVLNRLKGS